MVVATIVLGLAMILVGPLFVIWALNNLFTTGLDYSFVNWLSVVILTAAIRGTTTIKKEND